MALRVCRAFRQYRQGGHSKVQTKEKTLVLNESFSSMKIPPFILGYKGFKPMPNGSVLSFYLLAVHV